jgi:hypothetical protein
VLLQTDGGTDRRAASCGCKSAISQSATSASACFRQGHRGQDAAAPGHNGRAAATDTRAVIRARCSRLFLGLVGSSAFAVHNWLYFVVCHRPELSMVTCHAQMLLVTLIAAWKHGCHFIVVPHTSWEPVQCKPRKSKLNKHKHSQEECGGQAQPLKLLAAHSRRGEDAAHGSERLGRGDAKLTRILRQWLTRLLLTCFRWVLGSVVAKTKAETCGILPHPIKTKCTCHAKSGTHFLARCHRPAD